MSGAGIPFLTHSVKGSGGFTCDNNLYLFGGGSVRLRSIVEGFDNNSDLIDIDSPTRASILLCSSGIRLMADQIMPWHGCSGVFFGNTSTPFAGISVSGLYLKPVFTITPKQPGFRRYSTVEGDMWHRKAGELNGAGRQFFNTGSGIASISQASGFYYGCFNTASSGVPISTSQFGVVPFDKDLTNDRYFIHNATNAGNNTHIYCKLAGWYKIHFSIGIVKLSGGSFNTATAQLVKNNNKVIPGTYILCAGILNLQGNSAAWQGVIYLNAMDSISVQIIETSNVGDLYLLQNASSLCIEYIGPGI